MALSTDIFSDLEKSPYIHDWDWYNYRTPTTTSEIPTPVQNKTELLSNNKNLLLYGGIALAIYLLIKK